MYHLVQITLNQNRDTLPSFQSEEEGRGVTYLPVRVAGKRRATHALTQVMSLWLTLFEGGRVASSQRRSPPSLPFLNCSLSWATIAVITCSVLRATIVIINAVNTTLTFHIPEGKFPLWKARDGSCQLVMIFSVTNHKSFGWCGAGSGYQIQ